MDQDFQTIFNALEPISPEKDISSGVLRRIQGYQQRIARIRLAVFGVGTAVFAVALVPVFINTVSAFESTGFYQYLSLVFLDGAAVLPYWKEFSLSLVESLPAFEISLLLAVVFAVLQSLKLAIKNMPVAFYRFN